ncbi:hypothetical protein G3M48_010374 [Beauveria asiatica]|uniref:Uncharacterized protein n=1 Tax=Beauveria asiatica TaxID=1069075 RepID=A0AAW0RHK9_9HYPO
MAPPALQLGEEELDLVQELSDTGHTNWNPAASPETLLLEIETGILICETARMNGAGWNSALAVRAHVVLQVDARWTRNARQGVVGVV